MGICKGGDRMVDEKKEDLSGVIVFRDEETLSAEELKKGDIYPLGEDEPYDPDDPRVKAVLDK